MASQTTRIRNGAIPLPKELRRVWKNARVFVSAASDTIVVKRLSHPTLISLGPKLKQVGERITSREIEREIRAVRKKGA